MNELLLLVGAALIFYISVWYALARLKKDISIIDIAWGFGFVYLVHLIAIKYPVETVNAFYITLSALISVWGIRLGLHIGLRKIGKPEDERYALYRKKWGARFYSTAYIKIYLLQAALIALISAPVVVAAYAAIDGYDFPAFGTLQYVGIAIWLIGFAIETVSDYQLSKFVKTKKPGQIMKTGLWKYSRHPNYFGESVLWWGLWLFVVCLPYGYIAVISPLLITYLLLFVSGVPPQERRYRHNKEFQAYAKVTSKFVLLPNKKGK